LLLEDVSASTVSALGGALSQRSDWIGEATGRHSGGKTSSASKGGFAALLANFSIHCSTRFLGMREKKKQSGK
jgi:hypothetical protein